MKINTPQRHDTGVVAYSHDPIEASIAAILDDRLRRRQATTAYRSPTVREIADRLARHLDRQLDAPHRIENVRRMFGGASKEQFRFDLAVESEQSTTPMVLRCEPHVSIVETPRMREFELMRMFDGIVPVPRVLSIDADGADFGHPALIAQFASGVQKPKQGVSGVTGIGVHFDAAQRARLRPQFVEHLVAIHEATPLPGSLSKFDTPAVGTVDAALWAANWWARVWREDLYEEIPLVTLTECWLRTNLPVLDRVSVVHGDYRTGNFLFDEETLEITAILDWELGFLGDRHADLAWILSDLYKTTENGAQFYCGLFSSIDELISEYEAMGGTPIDPARLHFYRVFCAWKQVILSLGCALRAAEGHTHQDVLLGWLAAGGYPIMESLRRLLSE